MQRYALSKYRAIYMSSIRRQILDFMKSIYKVFLTLFISSFLQHLFSDDSKLELEFLKHFAADINTTYPHLLAANGKSVYPKLEEKLSRDIMSQRALLEIKSMIYDALEANEECNHDWYNIYHALHISSVRNSSLAKLKFNKLVEALRAEAKNATYDRLLAPASGKFFEFPDILNQFNSSLVVSEDIDYQAVEFTRGMFANNSRLVLRHSDLSKTQHEKTFYDALLFIHPHVTDYDKLSNSELYKKYNNEFHIPYVEIKHQEKGMYISDLWAKIITNSLSRLKIGGYAFFIFYEHRELDIITEWLSTFDKFKVVHSLYDEGMIDFAFSNDYLKALGTELENTAKYVVMGAYRAGLLVQKIE